MNAKDLMIGDFVYDVILQGYTKVEMLFPHGMKCDFHERVYDEKRFEPIPLTKEILEKNGWKEEFDKKKYMTKYHLEKDGFDQNGIGSDELELIDADYSDDTYVWQERDEYDNLFTISIYDLNCGSWQMEIVDSPKGKMDIEIKFVHELQHALRLCGIDKEIVL